MKRKIDSERGREMIIGRFAAVEPVFGNVRGNKKMDRFTLRGRDKVDGQWKLYCMAEHREVGASRVGGISGDGGVFRVRAVAD